MTDKIQEHILFLKEQLPFFRVHELSKTLFMLCGLGNVTVTKQEASTVVATDKPLLVEKALLDVHLNCRKKISKGGVEVSNLVVTQEFRDGLAATIKSFFIKENNRLSQQLHDEIKKISKDYNTQQKIQEKKKIEGRYNGYKKQLETVEEIYLAKATL